MDRFPGHKTNSTQSQDRVKICRIHGSWSWFWPPGIAS